MRQNTPGPYQDAIANAWRKYRAIPWEWLDLYFRLRFKITADEAYRIVKWVRNSDRDEMVA